MVFVMSEGISKICFCVSEFFVFLAAGMVLLNASGFVAFTSASAIALTPASVEETTCICDTQITKFIASNPSDVEDNYVFSVSGDEEWGVIAPFNAVLKPGDAADIYSFITPSCFAVPGLYSFTVSGKSTTEEAKSVIKLRVNPCIKIDADAFPQSACVGEKLVARFSLHNNGKTTSKNYSILLEGDAAKAASASEKEVWVAAGETKPLQVFIDSTTLTPGAHKLVVKAIALYPPTGQPTGDSDVAEIVFETRACQDIGIEVEGLPSPTIIPANASTAGVGLMIPEAFGACLKQKNSIRLKITNYGVAGDVVTLYTNATEVILEKTSVPIPANSSVFVNAVFEPQGAGLKDYVFKARTTRGVEKSVLLPVESSECAGVFLRVEGPKQFCSENGSRDFNVFIKNIGRPTSFKLLAPNLPFAGFAQQYISVNTGEEKEVPIEIPAYVSPENYTLSVRAVSPNASAKNFTRFEALDCFNVRVTAADGEVCENADKAFPFEVINLGTREDAYYVTMLAGPDWISFNETQNFSIPPNSKKTFFPQVKNSEAPPGVYHIVFSVNSLTDSTNVWDRVGINVTARSKEECYRARVSLPREEFVEPNASTVIAVRVLNNGLEENVYSLRLEAPEWINFTPGFPGFLRIPKGGERGIKLIVNPPASEVNKTFIVKLAAVSRGVSSSDETILRVVAVGEAQKLRKAAEAIPLPADVAQENGFITVRTLPEASVSFLSGNKIFETKTDSSGNARLAVNESSLWTITLKKQGYSDTSVSFEFKQPQKVTGAFLLDANAMLYSAILLVAVVLALYGVYLLSGRKKRKKK